MTHMGSGFRVKARMGSGTVPGCTSLLLPRLVHGPQKLGPRRAVP